MKPPVRKNYIKPFNQKLVRFNSKKYSKDLAKYVDYLHNEITSALEYLHNSGANLSDNGDQCYQILNDIVKNIR